MTSISKQRLDKLRSFIKEQEGHGFLVPRTDAYQGEYIAASDERLAWLTGFTGSAGLGVVLLEQAALFTDGRYTLQAQEQVDASLYQIRHLIEDPAIDWTSNVLKSGQKLFYDPWLITFNQHQEWNRACERIGAQFIACPKNFIDELWSDRPPPPLSSMVAHDLVYAGETSINKRHKISQIIQEVGADAGALSASESIAWLLNTRGNDIPHTPVSHCFAILSKDGTIDLIIDSQKVSDALRSYLGSDVRIHNPKDLSLLLASFRDKTVMVDPALTPLAILSMLGKNTVKILANDPCALPKACKNATEIAGAKAAHIRDGAAVTNFLAWLSKETAVRDVDELKATEQLLEFRQQQPLFQDVSFSTISATGPHGAIVHYHATSASNCSLIHNNLYLLDSGGQYLDGTTDITRTVAIGTPNHEHKDRFTRVLKGHIALATAKFPKGTSGQQLDALARLPLWQAGLDYDHGTGHGVGSYLAVHEGPQRISKKGSATPLEVGMIVSNEPGYYKAGEYGIRIESLVTVVVDPATPMLMFETITMAPIDRSLILKELLTPFELQWLNDYHQQVRKVLEPLVTTETKHWLIRATELI